jgi:hypothetical protein
MLLAHHELHNVRLIYAVMNQHFLRAIVDPRRS